MKKVFLPLALLLGGYLAYKYYGKAYVATKVINIKIRALNLKPINKANIAVELINPSNVSLSWQSMQFDLTIDGYALGSLNYLKSGLIAPNSSTTINLPIQINPVESLTFIAYLAKNKFKVNSIGLKGNINGEGFIVPIDIKQSING